MNLPLFLALVCSCFFSATSFAGQTIYYCISEGEDYGKKTWYRGDLSTSKPNLPEGVFDSYSISLNEDGTFSVFREYSTPSGDWVIHLIYRYGKKGKLQAMESDFRTFNGMSASGESAKPTRCVRNFKLSPEGKLSQISVRITNMETEKAVSRTFWEPKVEHWMTLEELPVKFEKPQTEPKK